MEKQNKKNYKKVKLVKKNKPEQQIEVFKQSVADIKNQLSKESKERKQMMNDAFKSLNTYSDKIIDYETTIKDFRLEEIKYKNKIRELTEYLDIYKTKSENIEGNINRYQDEVMTLRKKYLQQKRKNSSLISIVNIMIRNYGIENISELTGIEIDQIQKYIKED